MIWFLKTIDKLLKFNLKVNNLIVFCVKPNNQMMGPYRNTHCEHKHDINKISVVYNCVNTIQLSSTSSFSPLNFHFLSEEEGRKDIYFFKYSYDDNVIELLCCHQVFLHIFAYHKRRASNDI